MCEKLVCYSYLEDIHKTHRLNATVKHLVRRQKDVDIGPDSCIKCLGMTNIFVGFCESSLDMLEYKD